jgi:hypothetical protein
MRRLLFALILWFTGVLLGCFQVVYAYDAHFTLAAETTAARTFNPANFADDIARIRAESAARYGPGEGITAMAKPFSGDQAALVDLAKQAQRTGGVTAQEAQTLRQWAQEYGLPFRGPEVHPNRPFGQFPHIHVGPVNHLSVK